MNVLKLTRTTVKIIAGIISLAFFLNSANGVLDAIALGDGNVTPQDVQPGDFAINYNNLSISVNMNITNTGIYPIEGIIFSVKFELKSNYNEDWVTILENDTVSMGKAPEGGVSVQPDEEKIIGINVEIPDFLYNPQEIAQLLNLPPNWDLQMLIDLAVDARLTIGFQVKYAFGQYVLNSNVVMNNDAIKNGLGGTY